MIASGRVRVSHRIFHWESEGGYGAIRAIRARRNVSATATLVTGVAAVDKTGASYTLGRQAPRANFLTDAIQGANQFAGLLFDSASGDRISFAYNRSPALGPITVYVRFKKGAAYAAGVVLSLGGASGARLVISEYSATGYIATYNNGTTSYSSFTTTGAAIGDDIELRVELQAGTANVVRLYHAVNFQAEETGSASGTDGAGALAALASPTLYLGANAAGADPAKNTIRAVLIDGGISALTSFRTRNWTMPTYPASTAMLAEDDTELLAEDGTTLMSE